MIYENKILPRLTTSVQGDSTDIMLKIAGLEMISYGTDTVLEGKLLEECKKIIKHYMQSSDLLQFLSSAAYHDAYTLKYKLNPPITTSKMDCEYILNCLAHIGYLSDFSYSALSTSFWIELNRKSNHTIIEILIIGICGLINQECDIKLNVELRSQKENIWSDILVASDNKLTLINIELAAGLETNISSHISQLEKLKTKIIKAKKRTNNYLADYIVITPTVFKHLPKALQQMDCIMTIENIESKINELVI